MVCGSRSWRLGGIAAAFIGLLALAPAAFAGSTTSKPFSGAKVNGGTVTVTKTGFP